MKRAIIQETLERSGIIAVIRLRNADKLTEIIDALINGGIRALEITMTTPNAVEIIRNTSQNLSADFIIGAGTVLNAEAAEVVIGGFMVPMMKKEGYDVNFSAAVNITSSTTGLIIPPSNILIVYSLASGGVSIAALFLAGYLPGLLVGLMLMIVAGLISKKWNYPTVPKIGLLQAVKYFLDAIPSLLLIVIVIGGIIAGFFTATEA